MTVDRVRTSRAYRLVEAHLRDVRTLVQPPLRSIFSAISLSTLSDELATDGRFTRHLFSREPADRSRPKRARYGRVRRHELLAAFAVPGFHRWHHDNTQREQVGAAPLRPWIDRRRCIRKRPRPDSCTHRNHKDSSHTDKGSRTDKDNIR